MIFHHAIQVPHCNPVPWRLYSNTTCLILKQSLPTAAYKPEVVEKNKYAKWESDGRFVASKSSSKPSFSMVLPPPNVTGKLHLGHALACTVQDVIARRMRSLGYNVLWLPGTDHAGIATQSVVEKHLKSKLNTSRYDMGPEKFNKEVWKWKEKHGNTICQQLRTIGCSLDWSKQVFTMDLERTKAVNTAFIQLFHKGFIYRKKALVNWCNALKSTVSDIEVENRVIESPTDMFLPGYNMPVKFGLLYNFSYKIFDSNEEIIVSTTMPETMIGDTAIAVHPKDKRYAHLRDSRAVHPIINKTIPIIFDEFVDTEFGTGAVKLTPSHSKVDYDIAKRHNLQMIQVINENGCMMNAGPFNDTKRYECRQLLLEKLNEIGSLKSISPHAMTLPICSRTGDVIDHLPKEQWFLSCKELNEKATDLVKSGKLTIQPEKFVKNWLDWVRDDRDWCISRQLWWGHQIPAYKCTANNNLVWVAAEDETAAKKYASKYLRTLPEEINTERDCDVLDTWFSSGIYPFSSLGWPEHHYSPDFKKFFPLSLMATGHDILGFWVHRMVILGLELTGQLPFDKVLLHGIICDSKGAKMSKSKGNVIDPLDVVNGISMEGLRKKSEEMHQDGVLSKSELKKALQYHKSNFSNTKGIPACGVDALRFTLLSQDIKSHFVHFDVDLCHTNKLFGNKIWQSIKYTDLAFAKLPLTHEEITRNDLTYFDKWILSRLADMVRIVNESFDSYDFHIATKAIKTLIYSEFCDLYLESTKTGFDSNDLKMSYAHAHTLSAVLHTALRCLAPFMVYLTEEVIPKIPTFHTNIIHNFNDMTNPYFDFPKYEDFEIWRDEVHEKDADKILNTVFLVRQLKGFYGISNKVRPVISVKSSDDMYKSDIVANKNAVLSLTRCEDVIFDMKDINKKFVDGLLNKDTIISVELIVDDIHTAMAATKARLEKKIQKVCESMAKLEAKFASENYLTTVSEWDQILDREKLTTKKEELKQLQRLMSA